MSDEILAWFRSSAKARCGFCARCGSSLFWDADHRPTTGIMAGALDPPTGLRIESHIHQEDAGDYYDVGSGPAGTGAQDPSAA